MVILSSQQAARDLLEKRFAIYSDRPRLVLHCELYVTSAVIDVKFGLSRTNYRMGWQDSTIHQQ